MRIAFVVNSLCVGGAEKIVVSMADFLYEHGHDVIIIYLSGTAHIRPYNEAIRLIGLGVSKWWVISHSIKAVVSVHRILSSFRPNIVHSHLGQSNMLTRLVRMIIPIPRLINSSHNTVDGGYFRMLMYRATDFLTDISTNVSDEAVRAFISKKAARPGRMITIHNGIAIDKFFFSTARRLEARNKLNVGENTKIILAVGSLTKQKDYPNLLRALSAMEIHKKRYIAVIVGGGPLRRELENMSAALGIANSVRFLGVRHDIPLLMTAADVFVLPSAWEGFGLVVAEAMASERVVVATDCGGVKEVVGKAGILVRPGYSQDLASALMLALELPQSTADDIGRAARRRVEQYYSFESKMEQWLALYKDELHYR